jgi:hypothetical protein
MRLHEIDSALAIPDHDLTDQEIDSAPQVGSVDQLPVYLTNTLVFT